MPIAAANRSASITTIVRPDANATMTRTSEQMRDDALAIWRAGVDAVHPTIWCAKPCTSTAVGFRSEASRSISMP